MELGHAPLTKGVRMSTRCSGWTWSVYAMHRYLVDLTVIPMRVSMSTFMVTDFSNRTSST
jgi:hypothetical protein